MANTVRFHDDHGVNAGGYYFKHWSVHIDNAGGGFSEFDVPIVDPSDATRYIAVYIGTLDGSDLPSGAFDLDTLTANPAVYFWGTYSDAVGGSDFPYGDDAVGFGGTTDPTFAGADSGWAATVDPASDPDWYLHAPLPTITSLSPAMGPIGATVVITGVHLADVFDVRLDGIGASGTVVSDTEIDFTVPFGVSSGPVSLVLSSPAGSGPPFTFIVGNPAPDLTSLSPNHGIVGSAFTANGHNLTAVTSVDVSGLAASFAVVSDTQVTVTVPALPAGSVVGVTVASPDGTSNSLTFTVDYDSIALFAVQPAQVTRGCTLTIFGSHLDQAQAVRIGSFLCPDFYYDVTADVLRVLVPLTTPLLGYQDVGVLDGLGVWHQWHTTSPSAPELWVLDQHDVPFPAAIPYTGVGGTTDLTTPNANGLGLFEFDGPDPGHLLVAFTHPDTPSNPSIYSDIRFGEAFYFYGDHRLLGVTANNQDGLGAAAVGDSYHDAGGGAFSTYAVIGYHVDSGSFASQRFQVIRYEHIGVAGSTVNVLPIGSPTAGDLQQHNNGLALVRLSGGRVMVVADAAGVVGFHAVRCTTYSVNTTTGVMTVLDAQQTATFTLLIGAGVRDAWPIDGSRAIVLRGDGNLQVVSVDGAGLITFGALTNVVANTDVDGLVVCPDGSGGVWVVAQAGQLLDHYSIVGTTITRTSRATISTDDGSTITPHAILHVVTGRGDALLALGGALSFGGGVSWVIGTAAAHAGPLWFWGSGFGVGDLGGFTSQPRPAINLLGTTPAQISLAWVPTRAITPGDTDRINFAAHVIAETTVGCLAYVEPGGLHWGWPVG